MNGYKAQLHARAERRSAPGAEGGVLSVPCDVMAAQVSAAHRFSAKIQRQILFSLSGFMGEADAAAVRELVQNGALCALMDLLSSDDSRVVADVLRVIEVWIAKFPNEAPFVDGDFACSLLDLALSEDECDDLRKQSFRVLVIILCQFPNMNVLFDNISVFENVVGVYQCEGNVKIQKCALDLVFCLLDGEYVYNVDVISVICRMFENFHQEINNVFFDNLCDIASKFCSMGIDYARCFCYNVNVSLLFSNIHRCESKSQKKLLNFLGFFLSTNNMDLINCSLTDFSWNWILPIFRDGESSVVIYLLKVVVLIFQKKPEFIQLEENGLVINYICFYLNNENTKFKIKEYILNAVLPLFLNENYIVIEMFLNNGFLEISSQFLDSSDSNLCVSLILMFQKIYSLNYDNEIILKKMEEFGILNSLENLMLSENIQISSSAKNFMDYYLSKKTK